MTRKLWIYVSSIALTLLAFTGVTLAAGEISPDGGSLTDLAKPVFDAIMHHQYWLGASLALVAAVTLLKKFAPGKLGEWLHSDVGGSLCVLLMSFGGALATGLMANGTGAISAALAYTALKIALAAAGGYSLIKKLIIEPIIKPLMPKMPAWLQSVMQLLIYVFDKPAIEAAEQAGDAAVNADPAGGTGDVLGAPKDVP